MARTTMKSDEPLMVVSHHHHASYDNSTSTTPVNSFRDTSDAKLALAVQPTGNVIPRQFPPIFHLYAQPFSRSFHLGEYQDHPVYAVSTHHGWSGNPDVVLHTGTSKHDTPLAAAEVTHTIPTTLTIHLPALPGSEQDASIEPLVACGGISRRFRFSIEVDAAGAIREEFEWRHSSGSAIRDYACARQGWKLVRMATGPPSYEQAGYTSSDGKEVVAVWANVGMSMTKSWRFAFIGTGATGVLGERWAVMAVMTALLMWEQERRARARGTGSSS